MFPTPLPFPSFLLPLLFLLSALFLSLRLQRPNDDRKQPPGPRAWPVIGNLHLLGSLPRRSLQSLAKCYGPIMSLRLEQVPAVVVSSPEAAELFLKTHDVVFASRPKSQASEILSYGSKGMAFSEYGPYWRNMRKLCTSQLFSASKVDMFAPLRREELGGLVKSIEKSAEARDVVDLTEKVERLVEDIMYKMIFGRNRDDRFDMKGIVHETLDLAGCFNIADFVPIMGPFDIQGLQLCWNMNIRKVLVLTDCIEAINFIYRGAEEIHPFFDIIEDARLWFSKNWQIDIIHVSRDQNVVADRLANLAHTISGNFVLLDQPPPSIGEVDVARG